jgi:dipeptidyl aminopeptidase/acylaminoacyl peptidase
MRVLPILLAAAAALSAQKLPFDVNALLRIQRISEPQLSPDGRQVVFTVQTPDLDKNTRPKQIYIVPVSGGTPRQLTHEGDDNERPRWSPDSKQIYFLSNRGGSSQVWVMNADGTGPKQVTRIATEAGGLLISPDGKKMVFTSSVYPDCGADDACNQRKIEEDSQAKTKVRQYTSLLYRHWNAWQTRRRSHLMSANIDGTGLQDLSPGPRDVPPFSLGGPDDYAISPDSAEVAFTMNADEDQALSTNSDIYVTPIGGGEIKKISASPGADDAPAYSPDGKYLAFRSQARAGFESDRWRLLVLERATGKTVNLTESLDRWVESFTWSPDSTRIFFTVRDRGRAGLQMIQASGGVIRNIVSGPSSLDDVQFSSDGRTLIYTEESGSKPAEIYRASSAGGTPVALTHLNDALLSRYVLTPYEEFTVDGADKARVHSFLLKPPDFSPSKKYPALLLIHGGPQSEWGESWTYRWNAQVFAAAGYVVVMPNPRGSTGYGQKFIDEISGDWGGKVYDDLMAVTDYVAALPYVDADRMAAAGGSYGGYMVDWLLGHTNRFKALVSHAGVFDLRSEAGTTEELWFVNWEFKGMPWDNPDLYAKWSPSYYVKDFKTPTLVMHGEQDFRVPVGQGEQLFTALQIQKVPSKLVLFPDEGHWIQKPQNSLLWYTQFLDWIGEWTKKP